MKSPRIATRIILPILSFLILAACEKEPPKLAKDTRPIIGVKIAKVRNSTPAVFTSLSGKIQAENYVTVAARMMGYLTKVEAKVGDKIQAGQTLAWINNDAVQSKMAQVEAQILEAETGLQNIEKDYARIQSLFNKKSATQKELDDITSERDRMKAKLTQVQEGKNEIKKTLSYAIIKAPMSGVITEKWVQSGDLATPGKPLFTIESSKKFQAEAMVPASEIGKISKGQQVSILIKSTGQKIAGRIRQINPSAKNTGGQFLIKIDLDKKEVKNTQLFSGLFATILLPESKTNKISNQKIMIPQKAIIRRGQLTGVYTLGATNTALLRWVRLGKAYDNQVEVLSGLSLGENYILEQAGRLSDGIKVEVRNDLK